MIEIASISALVGLLLIYRLDLVGHDSDLIKRVFLAIEYVFIIIIFVYIGVSVIRGI